LGTLVANPSYTVDGNWYSDTGATDHVTHDLERLAMCDTYLSKEQIQTTCGLGMSIQHVGHSLIRTPVWALIIMCFLNNAFFEFLRFTLGQ
jgi:hypothetical protein